MDQDRTQRRKREQSREAGPEHEPEGPSPLLESARGWAGSAREAMGRVDADRPRELLETARRQGPGQ